MNEMAEPKRRVALRDVARRAGVSVGTVANVFANRSSVASELRAAVLEAAEKLGYEHRPQRAARAVGEVTMLGFVLRGGVGPVVENPFYSRVLHGAQAACAELDISLAYEVLSSSAEAGEQLPRIVENGQVPGILVAGHVEAAFLAMLRRSGLPFVLVDSAVDPPIADSVCGDDRRGGYLATRHLLQLGHTEPPPAVIGGPGHSTILGRLAGYRQALAELDLKTPEDYVRVGDLGLDGGRREMYALLDLASPPTAVFCINDLTAVGALHALRDRGIDVPRQCSLVGYDDLDLATATTPALTTVRVNKAGLAAQGVTYLLDRIGSAELPYRTTWLDVELVERDSTRPKDEE